MKSKRTPNDYESADKSHLWHPFTQMREWQNAPQLVIERAQGVYLYDVQGKKYMDGVSSLWANIHGHRHPTLIQAVRKQVSRLDHSTFLGLSNIPAIELAEALLRIAPANLSRIFYSDDGSTAVEVALKMSFQYWRQKGKAHSRKRTFVSFTNAYHGDTLGSVSLGGVDLFHKMFKPLLFHSIKSFYPSCYRCPFGKEVHSCDIYCFKDFRETLQAHHQEVCAVVVEPAIQGAAGMLTMPAGFLKQIERECRKYQVHLILDEVATGFGRTGTMFACEREKVRPDFLALAKGLSGGILPLAATLTTEEIFNGFLGEHSEFKSFFHGHTYTGNPVACAAAVANLRIFQEERTLRRLQPKIRYLSIQLKAFEMLAHVGDIRQAGFIVGIELVRDKKQRTPYPSNARVGHQVILEARQRGVILRPLGDVIVIMPPLSITKKQLSELLEATYESIRAVTGRYEVEGSRKKKAE